MYPAALDGKAHSCAEHPESTDSVLVVEHAEAEMISPTYLNTKLEKYDSKCFLSGEFHPILGKLQFFVTMCRKVKRVSAFERCALSASKDVPTVNF